MYIKSGYGKHSDDLVRSCENVINLRKRGISLKLAERFDWASAQFTVDDREDYGEVRMRAVGFLDADLYVFIFTDRLQSTRVISLRKAKPHEMNTYDEVLG